MAMSQPTAPVLTVRYNGPPRTFAAGHDVIVGRDLRAADAHRFTLTLAPNH